jgi:1,4-alpha-glucan branching enzyme
MKRAEMESVKKNTPKKSIKRTVKASPANGTHQESSAKVDAKPSSKDQSLAAKVAVAVPATAAVADKTVPVRFSLFNPRARSVSLCSEFNAWSPEAAPMRQAQDGRWQATVRLQPGRYQYKFVVDGEWMPDPEAREAVCNEHGTLNSVIEVQA